MTDDQQPRCPHCQRPLEIVSVRFGFGGSAMTWTCMNCAPERNGTPSDNGLAAITRAHVDEYVSLLNERDLAPETRAIIVKLLIEEENKLGHDLEQLEFAETRAARGRDHLKFLQRMRDVALPDARAQADRLVANVEGLQDLLDNFCRQLRTRVNSRL